MEPLGIYIHIPFCIRRCPYCGFYSNAVEDGAPDRIAEYFRLLGDELSFRRERLDIPYYVDSIYFGGGTPSLASPELIGGMIEEIRSLFDVTEDCEISMEANPGTLSDAGRLSEYRIAGVNRLSLGVQSFDDGVLRTLGRIHTAEDAVRAFDDARTAGFDNINVDLMFGVPGQTQEIWENTLFRTASMLPEHVSFYSLQIEEDTRFYHDYKMGNMVPVDDEEDRRMYHTAISTLRGHGYAQYEISNAALPGKECRHNVKYWTFRDYMGIGASASSFLDRVRMTDPGAGYEDFAEAGFPESGFAEYHMNSTFDNAADYMITGLRLAGGVDEEDFRSKFGRTIWEMFPDAKKDLSEYFTSECIRESDSRLTITEQGFDVSNRILEAFV